MTVTAVEEDVGESAVHTQRVPLKGEHVEVFADAFVLVTEVSVDGSHVSLAPFARQHEPPYHGTLSAQCKDLLRDPRGWWYSQDETRVRDRRKTHCKERERERERAHSIQGFLRCSRELYTAPKSSAFATAWCVELWGFILNQCESLRECVCVALDSDSSFKKKAARRGVRGADRAVPASRASAAAPRSQRSGKAGVSFKSLAKGFGQSLEL